MSIHLTRDLETLHQHIMSMCAVVEEVVHRAVDELGRPDVEVSQEIVDRDDEIDRWACTSTSPTTCAAWPRS